MLKKLKILFSQTRTGYVDHIIDVTEDSTNRTSLCGVRVPYVRPSYFTPMREDICKSCARIREKRENE